MAEGDAAQAAHEQAGSLIRERRFREAVEPAAEACRLRPDWSDAWWDYGVVVCEFRVKRPDDEPEFVRIARALAAAAADEPGTLRYQWFVTQRPGHYSIIEEYVDADAAETHNGNVGALLAQAFAVVELVSISFFGELNQYIRDWISGRQGVALNLPL